MNKLDHRHAKPFQKQFNETKQLFGLQQYASTHIHEYTYTGQPVHFFAK